jgi:hypothetical protein
MCSPKRKKNCSYKRYYVLRLFRPYVYWLIIYMKKLLNSDGLRAVHFVETQC